MHNYLRAIGLSQINNRKELKNILNMVVKDADSRQYVTKEEDTMLVEYRKEFANAIGICVCGEYDEENEFELEYYYPYYKGSNVSSSEDISVERHADKESYAGVCDDMKVGVSLIFYLQNRLDYIKLQLRGSLPIQNTSVNLSCLSFQGCIMLPITKDEKQIQNTKKATSTRNQLIAAARQGDEKAIESLTLEDIDTYSTISRKILQEDVFSLVDTYFMPYGIECDQYSILGEIVDFEIAINSFSKEEIYLISMNCNDLILDICISKNDLIGEPAPGRRFKGVVWMQGSINFPE